VNVPPVLFLGSQMQFPSIFYSKLADCYRCLYILWSILFIFRSSTAVTNEYLTLYNNIKKFIYCKLWMFRHVFSQLLFKLCALQKCPVTIPENSKPANTTIFLTRYEDSITN